MSQKTRSTLSIDAVAQAAAAGTANALNPLKKLDTIAALAGFVLRLFRSKEQLPPMAGRKRPAGVRPASGQAGTKGGQRHG